MRARVKPPITKRSLDSLLKGLVAPLGFHRSEPFRYDRRAGDVTGGMSFPCRTDARGFLAFSCIVGVRFDSVGRWIDDDDYEPGKAATVGTTLNLLRPGDNRFVEWEIATPDDWAALRDPILNDLTQLAVPFIERYSTLDAVRAAAETPTPPDGVIMSPTRRIVLQAAIRLAEGDTAGAIRVLDDALVELRDARPKDTFDIRYLRKKLG